MADVNVHIGEFTSLLAKTADIPPGDPDFGKTPLERFGGYGRVNNTVSGFLSESSRLADAIPVNKIAQGLGEVVEYIWGNDDALAAMDARLDALEAQSSSSGDWIDVRDLGAVCDGVPGSMAASTDNTPFFLAALLLQEATGKDIVAPLDVLGKCYDCYFYNDINVSYANNSLATNAGYLPLRTAGARILGHGIGKSVIRGRSPLTARARITNIVGNVLSVQVGDASHWPVHTAITKVSPNSDGSSPRTISSVCVTTAFSTGSSTITVNDASLLVGLAIGDYLWAGYGFALFKHIYGADASTVPYNVTFEGVELIGEYYHTTGNSAIDAISYGSLYSNPLGAVTTPEHTILFDRCRQRDGYMQVNVGGGPNLAHARTTLKMINGDVSGGQNPVFMSSCDDWEGRRFVTSGMRFHDSDATDGSHLNYIGAAVSISAIGNEYDGWPSAKYAVQHWGSTSTFSHNALWANNHFKSGGLSWAVLTNEHSWSQFSNNTFESYGAVQFRGACSIVGGTICPPTSFGSGSITNYSDAQYRSKLRVIGVYFNLRNVLASGHTCVSINKPVFVEIVAPTVDSLGILQDNLAVNGTGNAGTFLLCQNGSSGGYVQVTGGQIDLGTASGNVSVLAQFFGSCAGARFAGLKWRGRCGSSSGVIQLNTKTSADKLTVDDCDILSGAVGATVGSAIFTDANTPARCVDGRGTRWNGMKHTINQIQSLHVGDRSGPDITATATVVMDPDNNVARVSAPSPVTVSTINFPTTSQSGYDLATFEWIMTDSNVTLDTAGNISNARAAGPGRVRFTVDANAGKMVN